MIEVYDKSGNKFYIAGGEGSTFDLQDEKGVIHKVPSKDLPKNYSVYPPDVQEAMQKLIDMLKNGEITMDDIRRMKEAL